MKKIISFTFVVLLGISAAGLNTSPARAAALLIDSGGILTGATGVDVGGTLYDVIFADGTCSGLFSGCNEAADFAFTTQAGGTAAAQSLLDQVFIFVDNLNNFDNDPTRTAGCEDSGIFGCLSHIPYEFIAANSSFNSGRANNGVAGGDDGVTAAASLLINFDSANVESSGDIRNFALFTPSPVPLPAALPLFASALAGFGFFGWRRKAKTATA